MARIKAFSLLELLLTLAIIGILIAIALPSYRSYLLASRRLDAKTALLDLASKLENYYLIHYSYKGASFNKLGAARLSKQGYYELRLSVVAKHDFLLLATPLGPQQADKICGTYSLQQDGVKNITGTGTLQQCW
jgi:type IV pilus assembly protein PilE